MVSEYKNGTIFKMTQYAAVTREALYMKRIITVEIIEDTVIIKDYLNHPIDSYSRMRRTVMDRDMFDELMSQLGYVNRILEIES